MIGKGAKLRRIDIELYVKWIIWRDNQLDKLNRWILRRKIR